MRCCAMGLDFVISFERYVPLTIYSIICVFYLYILVFACFHSVILILEWNVSGAF